MGHLSADEAASYTDHSLSDDHSTSPIATSGDQPGQVLCRHRAGMLVGIAGPDCPHNCQSVHRRPTCAELVVQGSIELAVLGAAVHLALGVVGALDLQSMQGL